MNSLLKHLLAPLVSPFTLVLVLTVWALLHQRRRVALLCAIVAVLCLFGYPRWPWTLHRRLATQYPPATELRAGVTNIVVLAGSGFATDETVPVTGRASPEYVYRFLEGVRLLRGLAGSRMLVSVSVPDDPKAARQLLDELAGLVGVAPARLLPVVGARSTCDEARLMREAVGSNAFYLVTTDLHMPRAMLLFRQEGLQPLAAPVGSCARGTRGAGESSRLAKLYPCSANLNVADQTIHEYLGIFWARLTRRGKGSDEPQGRGERR